MADTLKVRSDFFKTFEFQGFGDWHSIESGEVREWPADFAKWVVWKYESIFLDGQRFDGLKFVVPEPEASEAKEK